MKQDHLMGAATVIKTLETKIYTSLRMQWWVLWPTLSLLKESWKPRAITQVKSKCLLFVIFLQ